MKTNSLLNCIKSYPADQVLLDDANGHVWTAAEVCAELFHLDKWLSQRVTGSGVALAIDNSPAFVIADVALLCSDRWCLPLPAFFTGAQVQHAMDNSGCQYCLSDQPAANDTQHNTVIIGGKPLYLRHTGVSSDDATHPGTAKLSFTSGSTGNPKGICLGSQHLLDTAASVAVSIDQQQVRTHLSTLPLAILLENVAGVYASLLAGIRCVLPSLALTGFSHKQPIDFEQFATLVESAQANSCILVPGMLQGLIHQARQSPEEFSTLSHIAVGGGHVSTSLLEQAANLGLPVYEGYGLSEAASVVSTNKPGHCRRGSVGKLLPHNDVLVAEDNEILLKQPGFLGFCGDPNPPPAPFATGDTGYLDKQGYLFINGRQKSLLISSMGRNIAPEWVESELSAETDIAQAYVYGDRQAHLSALLVSQASDSALQLAVTVANSRLPDYAQIADWSRVDAFTPENRMLTATGKLRRTQISQQHLFPEREQACR